MFLCSQIYLLALATVFQVLFLEPTQTEALNILVLHPLHGASHEAQLRTIAEQLLKKNHQLTIVRFKSAKHNIVKNSKNPQPSPPANLTLITLTVPNKDGSVPFITKSRHGRFELPLKHLWDKGLCPVQVPLSSFLTNDALCKILLPPNGRLRRRLGNYDVAIVDAFANECGLALAHSLGVPSVIYWALPISAGEADYAAGLWRPPPMANSPGMLTKLTDQMTYLQRAYNAFFRMGGHLVMSIQFWYTHSAIQRYLPGTPHPRALLEDVAGFLENSDLALDYPRALPPNVINVGCLQCRPPKTLPKDLEEFVEGSGSAGIVVFSMGATIDASVAPRAFFRRLLNVFARLPQRVLMKFDGDIEGEEIPPNVRILSWMPQQDLLGHKKTRAFFSHCGLHGAMEAVYHAVPVVGMPIFGDQTDVAEMIEDKGMGVRLAKDASEDEIYTALSKVIEDPRYRENALKRREILLDTQQTPMGRAIWFVEYIARHKGAPHLRLGTRHYNAIQLFGLDVLPLFILGSIILFYLLYKTLRIILGILFSSLIWAASKIGLKSGTNEPLNDERVTHHLIEPIPLLGTWIAYSRKILRFCFSADLLKQRLLENPKELRKKSQVSSGCVQDIANENSQLDGINRLSTLNAMCKAAAEDRLAEDKQPQFHFR